MHEIAFSTTNRTLRKICQDINKNGLRQCAKLQDLGDCDCSGGKVKSQLTSYASHKNNEQFDSTKDL